MAKLDSKSIFGFACVIALASVVCVNLPFADDVSGIETDNSLIRHFLLSGHVEPSFIVIGVTETFVSKDRIALRLGRNEEAFDIWLPACHAC